MNSNKKRAFEEQNSIIFPNMPVNNNVGGVTMKSVNTKVFQTNTYEFGNSKYEVVRIFGENKINKIIEDSISIKREGMVIEKE